MICQRWSIPTPGIKLGSGSERHFQGSARRGLAQHGAGSSGSSGWWQAACRDAGAASPNSSRLLSGDQPRPQAGSGGGRRGSPGVPKGEAGRGKGPGEGAEAWRARSWRAARSRARRVSALPEPHRSLSTQRGRRGHVPACLPVSRWGRRSTAGLSSNRGQLCRRLPATGRESLPPVPRGSGADSHSPWIQRVQTVCAVTFTSTGARSKLMD